MSRRRQTYDSSLELLLDTICNTFGGILFLAILVSLLLRTTRDRAEADLQASGPAPAMSRADLIRVEAELKDATDRIDQLKKSIELSGQLSESLATPEIRSELKRLDSESVKVLERQRKEGELLARLATIQAATADAKAAVAQSAGDLAEARQVLADAERQLDEAEAEKQVLQDRAGVLAEEAIRSSEVEASGAAPRERVTGKREWPLLIRYGRVYQLYRSEGEEEAVNTEHFDVQKGILADSAHARIGAGVSASRPDFAQQLSSLLRERPPAGWYIAIAVFPDSFDAFQRVKAQLVSRGYEYRIIPTDQPVKQSSNPDVKVQ